MSSDKAPALEHVKINVVGSTCRPRQPFTCSFSSNPHESTPVKFHVLADLSLAQFPEGG
ncbi:hypothetical protein PtB15_12B470 [Puccinia triticina]|nr:hypothetical protein PtB15_12B470 [Puccinia triticina]